MVRHVLFTGSQAHCDFPLGRRKGEIIVVAWCVVRGEDRHLSRDHQRAKVREQRFERLGPFHFGQCVRYAQSLRLIFK